MAIDLRLAGKQLRYLGVDLRRMVNRRWWRWASLWASASVWTNVTYRFDRTCYLLLGKSWVVVRPLCFPVFLGFRLMGGRGDIHYRADVGQGLLVLHPELGVVISGHAVIGRNLVLTGGNCIGIRGDTRDERFIIGDHVTLGANAVVVGPVQIGDRVTIGAGAVVVHDAPDDVVMVGVPAKPLARPSSE